MATISDNFDRPDGPPGASWVLVSGLWTISSNLLATGATGATIVLRAATAMATSDHFAQIAIAATTAASQGVWCRGDATLNAGYMLRNDGSSWGLFKVVGGVFTSIGSFTAAAVVGDVARVQAVGSKITGWVNGVIVITVTDTAVTSGTSVGLRSVSTSGLKYDNFLASDVVTGATLGVASSTETAQALTSSKGAPLGPAAEVGAGQQLTGAKGAALGVAAEVGAAQQLAGGKSAVLSTPAEADAAQLLSGSKAAGLTTAAAVEAARPFAGLVTAALGTAGATEMALPLTGSMLGALGLAAEVAAAQALAGAKSAALPAAASVESAQGIVGAKGAGLGPGASVEAARPLVGTATAALGPAMEISTASPLTGSGPGPSPDAADVVFTAGAAPERWTASEPAWPRWSAGAGSQRWTAREPNA